MNWLVKAVIQKGLSALPASERANYVFQRRVARTLPVADAGVRRKFGRALAHFAAFREHGPARPPERVVFYEFGAGWDLLVQLSYAALGVGRQVLVDIRRNVRLELVNESLAALARLRPALAEDAGHELRDLGPPTVAALDELEERFGIAYLAPRDARATGLPDACVDFVSSTNTLEHVPAEDIRPILAECARLLRPDGVMSFRIDMRDHAAYADPNVSPYNFLRFSARAWALVTSSLSYQNRLRYPDYVRLFGEAGLEIVTEAVARPTGGELEALARLELAPEFRAYALGDLAAHSLAVVLRPGVGPGLSARAQELEEALGGGGRARPGARA